MHVGVLEQQEEPSLNADTGSIIANGPIQSCWSSCGCVIVLTAADIAGLITAAGHLGVRRTSCFDRITLMSR